MEKSELEWTGDRTVLPLLVNIQKLSINFQQLKKIAAFNFSAAEYRSFSSAPPKFIPIACGSQRITKQLIENGSPPG